MKFKIIIFLTLLLTACGGSPTATPDSEPTDEPIPTDTAMPTDLPIPTDAPLPTDEPKSTNDPNLMVGNVYLDSSELFIMESYPIQVSLHVTGNLPTPCHELIISRPQIDENNQFHIEISSSIDMNVSCIAVLDPFETTIPLDLANLADGKYSVHLNGELVGEFTYPG